VQLIGGGGMANDFAVVSGHIGNHLDVIGNFIAGYTLLAQGTGYRQVPCNS
jgi:hypothetical protein